MHEISYGPSSAAAQGDKGEPDLAYLVTLAPNKNSNITNDLEIMPLVDMLQARRAALACHQPISAAVRDTSGLVEGRGAPKLRFRIFGSCGAVEPAATTHGFL